jgi:hypothetical protein
MIQVMDGIRMGVSPKNTKIVSCPILLFFLVGVVLMGPKDDWWVFRMRLTSLFGWLVADGWCWFALREKYCWLVADG